MAAKKAGKIELPEIGDIVAYFPRDIDSSGDPRVAMVTEYGSKPGYFNLHVFCRPMADVLAQGAPPVNYAVDVPFEPEMSQLRPDEPWCGDDSRLSAMPRRGETAVAGPDDRERRILEKHARQAETVPPGGEGGESDFDGD